MKRPPDASATTPRSALVSFAAWCGQHARLDGERVRRLVRQRGHLVRRLRGESPLPADELRLGMAAEAQGYTLRFDGEQVTVVTPTGERPIP